jgi:hypothetical protein
MELKSIMQGYFFLLFLCSIGFCALSSGRKILPKLLFKFFLTLLVLLLLLVLYGLAERTYKNIRNYYGYCTWEKGDLRGRRFTTEERLDIAINDYLGNQINLDYQEIGKAEGMRRAPIDDLKNRFTLIPYSGKDEFLRVNPDCCQLTWHLSEFGFWERADGIGDGMFDFKHKVRYMNQEGSLKEIETTNTYIEVNNCGHPGHNFYG